MNEHTNMSASPTSHKLPSKKAKHTIILLLGLLATGRSVDAAVITTVDSIGALKSVNPATFDTAQVVDYYAATSSNAPDRGRGGGLFKWVANFSPTEDGGRYIKSSVNPSGGVWERQFQGDTPNVKMWGATGNGVDDDTSFIKNAISSLRGGYGRAMANDILFPAGKYKISDTIEIFDGLHIRGEGSANATDIFMVPEVVNKDIFRTTDATFYYVGGLVINGGNGTLKNSRNDLIQLATGLLIENLHLYFGASETDYARANVTGSGIVLTGPNETTAIRNVFIHGGYCGIRVLLGGTPGLKADNLGLFSQALAGIMIEGTQTSTLMLGDGGPMTLNSISGDSFYQAQALNNSLIYFNNCAPNVTINDLSAEGKYGGGIVRCDVPYDNGYNLTASTIALRGGTVNASALPAIEQNLVVLNNSTTTPKMPIVTIDPMRLYGVVNLIWDKWQGRKVPADVYYNQVPVRRPMYYTSSTSGSNPGRALDKRSLLVIGDTAYYSFIPARTGWWRVAQSLGALPIVGGRLAVNTYWDSSELSFNLSRYSSDIQVNRKSKIDGTWNEVTQARAYSWYNSGSVASALDIYVSAINPDTWPTEQRYVTLTLPLEGRTELSSGLCALRDPIFAGSVVTDSYPNDPGIPSESYLQGTGPVSLTR